MLNKRSLLLVIACFLACHASAIAQTPASIDHVTPRTQNGLTVLAVVRGDAEGQYSFPVPPDLDFLSGPRMSGPPGGIGLWIRGVRPPAQTGPRHFSSDMRPSAHAHALNGDDLSMQAEVNYNGFSQDRPGGPPAPLFLATLPGDYPIGYPAIDVNFSDGLSHSAHWRLVRLAPTFHALVPPVVPKTVFHGADVVLTARAWQDIGPTLGNGSRPSWADEQKGIRFQFDAKTPPGTNWLLRITKQQLEWDALRPGEREAMQTRYGRSMRPQVLWTAAFGPDVHFPMQNTVRTPYGKYNHAVRLSGQLVQMASAEESVTFHDLNIRQSKPPPNFGRGGYAPSPSYEISARPQTVTTPSGISVSLLPLPEQGGYGGGDTGIRMALKFTPAPPGQSYDDQRPLVLLRSPLYKKYHKLVTYFLRAQKPYILQYFSPGFYGFGRPGSSPAPIVATLRMGYATGEMRPVKRTLPSGRVIFTMPPPPNMPKHLDSLTFTLSQRAELRSLPVSFVVPVGPAPPIAQGRTVPGRPFFAGRPR